jgi:hypothetical protein
MTPPFIIHKFYHKHVEAQNGQPEKVEHWVEYGPKGRQAEYSRVHDRVSRLINHDAPGFSMKRVIESPTNPASRMAMVRADYIKKNYLAWVAGQELPETGTPLSAWNGVTAEQADVLKTKSYKTVEAIAAMTDTDIEHVPLPYMRRLREEAKRFVSAADSNKVSQLLAARDVETAALKDQLTESVERQNEMARMIEELMAQKRTDALSDAAALTKRPPGRPRKEVQAAA